MRQIAATRRLVRTAASTRLCAHLVAAICRMNSNQFEFVRQITATKFCGSDNDFHMSHEAICCSNLSRRRVAAICRIVCLGLYSSRSRYLKSENNKTEIPISYLYCFMGKKCQKYLFPRTLSF